MEKLIRLYNLQKLANIARLARPVSFEVCAGVYYNATKLLLASAITTTTTTSSFALFICTGSLPLNSQRH